MNIRAEAGGKADIRPRPNFAVPAVRESNRLGDLSRRQAVVFDKGHC